MNNMKKANLIVSAVGWAVAFLAIGFWTENVFSRSSSSLSSTTKSERSGQSLSISIDKEEWSALPAGTIMYNANQKELIMKSDLASVTASLIIVNHEKKKVQFQLPAALVGNDGSLLCVLRLRSITVGKVKQEIWSDQAFFIKAGQTYIVELMSSYKDYKELHDAQPLHINIPTNDMKLDLKPMPSWKFLCEKRDEKTPKSSSDKPSKSGGATYVNGMTWVSINDPGIAGHESFTGEMSKYETTNAQYCQFLNAAIASGDLTVGADNIVYGADGANSGADFVGEIYFATAAADSESQIIYSSGTFSVLRRDGHDVSNHPVVEVSWYGATAFCNYYEFRLPTAWEWQAVADYDGSYTYGCGTTIDRSKANYFENGYGYANPLNLSSKPYTSSVDYYPSYGYGMNDMAGNVLEWTSDTDSDGWRTTCGGYWGVNDHYCSVGTWRGYRPHACDPALGFRVVNSETEASSQEVATLADQNEAGKATAELKALSDYQWDKANNIRMKFYRDAYDIAQLRALIKAGADVNVKNKNGVTPLTVASDAGLTDVVKLLLEAGADVNATDNIFGFTPLWTASKGSHIEVVKLLLAAGADVNAAHKTNGVTALWMAAQNGHTEVVKVLLEAKADVNAKAHTKGRDYTPLSIAKQMGHGQIIALLKEYGAKD